MEATGLGLTGLASTSPRSIGIKLPLLSQRLGWKGTSEGPWFQPLPWAGTPPSIPGARSPIQPGLELFQGWGSRSSSEQPAQRLTNLVARNCFLAPALHLPSFSLKPFAETKFVPLCKTRKLSVLLHCLTAWKLRDGHSCLLARKGR